MRVLQVNTVVGTGSVGRITASLYERSTAKGIDAYVGYGRGTAPEQMRAVKIGTSLDMYAHVLRNFLMGESGFGSARRTKAFLRELDELKPDLIHLHNIHGFYLQIELLFSYIKEKNMPVVWTLHDCWPMTGHCAYFDYVGCDKWKTGCHHCEQHRSAYPYALFKDHSVLNYERKKAAFTGVQNLTIVTPSKWLADLVKQSFLREYPVEVIPNGIDRRIFRASAAVQETQMDQFISGEQSPGMGQRSGTEQFTRAGSYENGQNRTAEDRKIQLLGVANIWEKRKGFIYFQQLARRLPENYHITMVGLKPSQIKEIEKDSLLKNKITGVTRTENQQELADLYNTADLYINTTLEDNFPTTNLEALACGTPVITFATGGSPEPIQGNPLIGAAVPATDVQALYTAVMEYAGRPKPVKECVKRAEQYDSTICFQKYIDLYKSLYGKVTNESEGIHHHHQL
ncbi:MAG: glycosyltransferase [Lachnospiraceae bacterium]|nr:glycosyltransferase [Lachnospiraceae bacterium]